MENENSAVRLETPHSLAGFLLKYRKLFTGLLAAIIAVVALFFVVSGVTAAGQKKELAVLEDLVERYEKLAGRLEENPADAEVETLRADLQSFAEKAHGYPGAKAWALSGAIYAKQVKWPEAANAFGQAAQKGKKTHLYGTSLFNAGVAAEESGDREKALDYYTRSIAAPENSIGVRAQFALGRLQEELGDREAARLAYRNVLDNYTGYANDVWRNFAQSRLIVLED
jgi:tetratricopeptide (TPR) repeat protein